MKFLTKVGQILLKATQVITGLSPIFPGQAAKLARTVDTLEQVSAVIVNVEAFGLVLNTPGADKLRAATPVVAQIILQSDLMAGKKINDKVLFMRGCTGVTDGMADILNSLKDNIDTEDVT